MSTQSSSRPQHGSGVAVNRNGTLELSEYAYRQIQENRRNETTTRENAVRTNASMPPDTWSTVDDTVYRTFTDTLTIVDDLRSAGLVTQRDIMAKFDYWPVLDDEGQASVDMDPETEVAESSLTSDMVVVPVPIIHDAFSLGFREGPAEAEAVGDSLDTLGLSVTARHVAERIERLFVPDPAAAPYTVNDQGRGAQLYGLTNHPDANTGTFSADWRTTATAADGTTFRDDVRAMRSVLKSDNNVSPGGQGYWFYLGSGLYDALDDADPEGTGDQTIRDRVEGLANIGRVRELEYLPDGSALMFRPTEDVIDVGVARDIQAVQWEDPFRDHWRQLASIYPRVKSTASGQSGIAFWTAP